MKINCINLVEGGPNQKFGEEKLAAWLAGRVEWRGVWDSEMARVGDGDKNELQLNKSNYNDRNWGLASSAQLSST